MHCLYRRSFKTKFEICKDEDGEFSDIHAIRGRSGEMIIPPRLGSQVEDSLQGYNSFTPWIEREINTLLQKLDWWQKKNNMKKEDNFSSQLLICFNNDANEAEVVTDIKKPRKVNKKFFEDLSKTQSTQFTCPQRKNEFWHTESKPSLRTSPC